MDGAVGGDSECRGKLGFGRACSGHGPVMAALASGLERARHTHRDNMRAAREKFAGPVTYAAGPWETARRRLRARPAVRAGQPSVG